MTARPLEEIEADIKTWKARSDPAQRGDSVKYKAYAKYKDSGVEWLGEVPEHWRSKRDVI